MMQTREISFLWSNSIYSGEVWQAVWLPKWPVTPKGQCRWLIERYCNGTQTSSVMNQREIFNFKISKLFKGQNLQTARLWLRSKNREAEYQLKRLPTNQVSAKRSVITGSKVRRDRGLWCQENWRMWKSNWTNIKDRRWTHIRKSRYQMVFRKKIVTSAEKVKLLYYFINQQQCSNYSLGFTNLLISLLVGIN